VADQKRSKADPAAAQYVVNLTPEQYESHLKQTAEDTRPQMEVGGSGIAKVSFKDMQGADVKIASSQWTSTGPVTVTPDDADPPDPTSAKLVATAPGRATIKAAVTTESGAPAEASVEVVVIETGTPVAGTIEVSVQAPEAPAHQPAQPPAA
jgi:hypothetical protein